MAPLEIPGRPADDEHVMLRARADDGFGLVELMISLVVLNVGVLAIVAAFSSGAVTIRRAQETQTALSLADKQMELFRAIRYVDIYLDSTSVTTADSNASYSATRPTRTPRRSRRARR